MSYKKDQGRYARMAAFWGLFLLMAYGCLGGLVGFVGGLLGGANKVFVETFPLIDRLDLARVLCIATLLAGGYLLHRLLSKPKAVDMLIETESEMKKVTWPSALDTWNGTLAVAVTVAVLFAFLTGANFVLGFIFQRVMGALG